MRSLLDRVLTTSENEILDGFDGLREQLNAAAPAILPLVHEASDAAQGSHLQLLATVLGDQRYSPAGWSFVHWLRADSQDLRFVSARAIDEMAGGPWNLDEMGEPGPVEHDQLLAVVPQMEAWWREQETRGTHPTADPHQTPEDRIRYTVREKRFNFIELNPTWAVLGNGVLETDPDHLPRDLGIHVLAGQAVWRAEQEPTFVAIELDSSTGTTISVNARGEQGWVDVTRQVEWVEPSLLLAPPP